MSALISDGKGDDADGKTLKRRLFDRYTCIDRPYIVYIDGCRTVEVRQIETNLKTNIRDEAAGEEPVTSSSSPSSSPSQA